MKLRDHIKIAAPVELVWPFLADPVQMSLWNDKIVAIDRDSEQPVRFGERFQMIHRMGNQDTHSRVTVLEVEPYSEVTYEYASELEGKPEIIVQRPNVVRACGSSRKSTSRVRGYPGLGVY